MGGQLGGGSFDKGEGFLCVCTLNVCMYVCVWVRLTELCVWDCKLVCMSLCVCGSDYVCLSMLVCLLWKNTNELCA